MQKAKFPIGANELRVDDILYQRDGKGEVGRVVALEK